MDVLIFQIERLFEEIQKVKLDIDQDILASLYVWFSERVKEVNKSIKKEGGFELEIKAETPKFLDFFSFLGITAKLKANITGNKENAEKIRTTFRSNFTEFAQKTNEFFEAVNMLLRKQNIAREILFVIDGLEKTATFDIRKKIIIDEGDRISQIKANTICTLPIELMSQTRRLMQFCTVVSFPFVKVIEKNGDIVGEAVKRFEVFIYKRIESSLFDSPEIVRKAILLGGGSPRDLLRILEYTNMYADEDDNKIFMKDFEKATKKLAAQTAQYVTANDLALLKTLKVANEKNEQITFDDKWQNLIESQLILEYNDGTYKKVNPILEISELYKQHVG
jgi:hypothetical protein